MFLGLSDYNRHQHSFIKYFPHKTKIVAITIVRHQLGFKMSVFNLSLCFHDNGLFSSDFEREEKKKKERGKLSVNMMII